MSASRTLSISKEATTDTAVHAPIKRVHELRESRLFLPDTMEATAAVTDHYGEKHLFRIINLSAFGLRIQPVNSQVSLHMNQKLNEVEIRVNGHEIFRGGATVVNDSATGQGASFGIALEGYGVDIDKIQALLDTREKYDNLKGTSSIVDISRLVKPEFKIQIANLNALFQDLKIRLAEEEQRIKAGEHSESYRHKLEEAAVDLTMSLYQHEIHKTFEGFQPLVDSLSSEEKLIHKRFFRVSFHPLLLGSPFIDRAFKKPLGYAGDYGLMVMFYEYQDKGASLFDKFMHRFSCNEPSSVANKNRVEFLCEELTKSYAKHCAKTPKGTPFKISSVACGPAREIELFLTSNKILPDYPVHAILIDQEPRALEYANQRLRPLANPQTLKLTLLAEDAVLGIIKDRPFASLMQGSKAIISAGLFDYLSDRVASRLIEAMYPYLDEKGTMYIGNVSKNNPDRFSMEFLMEWQLVLRDVHDLKALVHNIPATGCKSEVVSEALGLNLFLIIAKGA